MARECATTPEDKYEISVCTFITIIKAPYKRFCLLKYL